MKQSSAVATQDKITPEKPEKATEGKVPATGISARRIEEMREKASGLKHKSLRLRAIQKDSEGKDGKGIDLNIRAERKDEINKNTLHGADDESVLMLTPANAAPAERPLWSKMVGYAGILLTALWGGACVNYMIGTSGLPTDVPQFGLTLTAMLAPIALFWMMLGHAQRAADIQHYAETLRTELQSIIFPSDARAQRVSQDIERLCQQASELASSSRAVIKSIARARQGLRTEVRDFVGISKKTEFHIDRLSETLNERATRLLTLTEEIEKRKNF